MKEHKEGTLKSGSGKKVKSRKQAVAIALSEARKSGSEDSQEEKEVVVHPSYDRNAVARYIYAP